MARGETTTDRSVSLAWAVIVAAAGSYVLCPTADVATLQLRVLLGIGCALVLGSFVTWSGLVTMKTGVGAFLVSTAVGIGGAVVSEIANWVWR